MRRSSRRRRPPDGKRREVPGRKDGARRKRLIKAVCSAIEKHFEGLADDDAPESYPLAIGPGLEVKAVDGPEDVPEGWSYEEITDLEGETIADLADRILCE